MTSAEKLTMVKALLQNPPSDALLTTYLTMAKNEILSWRYSYNVGSMPDDVPSEYEMTQIQAVINGFTQSGNEGQSVSIENGIHRHFEFSDMVRYIRANVIAIAGVPRQSVPDTGDDDADDQDETPTDNEVDQNEIEQP